MRGSTNAARRQRQLLPLAVGAIPLSLCSITSAGAHSSDSASFTWINGSSGGVLWAQSNPGAVQANSRKLATSNYLSGPPQNIVSSPLAITDAATPNLAADLTLTVNVSNGDVYAQASAATAFTGYQIYDASNNLLDSGDPNTDMNERLLSKSATSSLGNTTTYRNATNYKLWAVVLGFDNGSTLAESLNSGKFRDGTASTYDTINIPANGTIDFGHIFNPASDVQDLYFEFLEPDGTGDPNGGPDYKDARVSYTGMTTAAPSSYLKNTVTSGNWSTASNWSATSSSGTDNAGPPPSTNIAYVTNADTVSRSITLDQDSSVAMLDIGNTGGGSDSLIENAPYSLSMRTEIVGIGSGSVGSHIQSDGTNTYAQALVVASRSGSIGNYSLSGDGAIAINTFQSGTSGLNVGDGGNGTFNQGGGSVTINGTLFGNLYLGNTPTGAGTYLLTSGSLAVAGAEYVGNGGAGTFNQSGGTNTQGGISQNTGGLYVGYGGAGTYDLSGGTLTISTIPVEVHEYIGYTTPGAFNQSGGVHNCTSSIALGYSAAGTYTLSNGSLNVSESEQIGFNGSGTFNQSGGINTVPQLYVGPNGPSPSPQASGSYLLSGGTLAGSSIWVYSADQDPATFTQSGGLLTAIDETIEGGGETTFVQTGGTQIIGTTAVPGGMGIYAASFSLSETGSLTVQGNLYVGTGGTLSQSGGTLTLGQLNIESGGKVQLTGGTFSAQIMQTEQLNSAGFGTFTTTNSFSLSGVLAVYLDAASEASTTSTQSFIILETTNGGTLSGVFSNISSGQTLTTTDGSASFLITINEGVDGDVVLSDFQLVPEPGMLGVLGLGGIALMRRRRKSAASFSDPRPSSKSAVRIIRLGNETRT